MLQAHSLEEGVFKSDHIRIGNGCSIGPGAFVHYGVTMGDHVVLDADSLPDEGRGARTRTPAGAAIRRSWCAAQRKTPWTCARNTASRRSRPRAAPRGAADARRGQTRERDRPQLAGGRAPQACAGAEGSRRQQSLFDRAIEVRSERPSARGLRRKGARRLPDVRRVGDEGESPRGLDLPLHDRPQAPGQGIRPCGARASARRDQGHPWREESIDRLHAGEPGRQVLLRAASASSRSARTKTARSKRNCTCDRRPQTIHRWSRRSMRLPCLDC